MAEELTKQDRMAWRRLLGTEAGLKGMLWLREQIPGVGSDAEEHQIVFQAGVSEGFRQCLNKITEVLVLRDPEEEDLEGSSGSLET